MFAVAEGRGGGLPSPDRRRGPILQGGFGGFWGSADCRRGFSWFLPMYGFADGLFSAGLLDGAPILTPHVDENFCWSWGACFLRPRRMPRLERAGMRLLNLKVLV